MKEFTFLLTKIFLGYNVSFNAFVFRYENDRCIKFELFVKTAHCTGVFAKQRLYRKIEIKSPVMDESVNEGECACRLRTFCPIFYFHRQKYDFVLYISRSQLFFMYRHVYFIFTKYEKRRRTTRMNK